MTDQSRSPLPAGDEGETLALTPGRRPATDSQAGYTIIEVMIAMLLLIVGVFGTMTLVEGSLASTSRTTAREQGTNLARDLVERSRQADYDNVTLSLAPATLRATLPASDAATPLMGSVFNVKRRNVLYSVNVFACSIDDPTDGAGVGNATFCETPTTPPAPGSPPPGAAASVNVLGIAVALSGSLLQTACNALGVPAIVNTLLTSVSAIAPISVCPTAAGGGSIAFDNEPDDLRRVRIDVTWTRDGHSGSVSQTTLLTNPVQS